MKKVLVTIASIALALVITGCGMSVMNPVSDPSVTITPVDVAPTIQVYPAQVVLSTPSPSPTFTPAPTVVTTPIPVPSASQQSTLPPYTTAPLTPSSLQTPAPALPIITKSPTDETVEEGGSCWFIAKYENATTAVWHFLSPDGQTDLTYESAQNRFPKMEIVNGMYSDLQLKNIPLDLDGWKVFCRYGNSNGTTDTGKATIYVRTKSAPAIDYSYNGSYISNSSSQNITIKIKSDLNQYYILISRNVSNDEVWEWTMQGIFDDRGVLEYNNCEKSVSKLISVSNYDSTLAYENGTGRLIYVDGGIKWEDNQEKAGEGIFFIHQQ